MPTTHAERTIQSVISLKHRWRNPLNRMRSSAVGLHPLPIELWEEIFAIATDTATYWAEKERSWCTISTPFFTAKEEDLLRDPAACDNQRLLRTRHSIILVCKSWYFMGIPILWSHLQFNEKDPRNVATIPDLHRRCREGLVLAERLPLPICDTAAATFSHAAPRFHVTLALDASRVCRRHMSRLPLGRSCSFFWSSSDLCCRPSVILACFLAGVSLARRSASFFYGHRKSPPLYS